MVVAAICGICYLEILPGEKRSWRIDEPVHEDCLIDLHEHLDEEHRELDRR